jgi:hypothetical protein
VQWDALDPYGAFQTRGDMSGDRISEDEGEDTGRKTSSQEGFRGDVEDSASNTKLNRKDVLHLCCDYRYHSHGY